MATVMGNGNNNGDGVGNNNGDGNGDCNDNGHGEGDNDKSRVASSCAGNVQCYGRGDTLPPPPWTQRKVHSPGLFFCLLFSTTLQFTEQPSVRPPHYSGTQEPCQPIDALPPPLLQECRVKGWHLETGCVVEDNF